MLTELESQLRDTSAPSTHDNDLIVLEIWRGSIRASFVPVEVDAALIAEIDEAVAEVDF
jgi:recombination protein RecA